jgi:hypothetical protein
VEGVGGGVGVRGSHICSGLIRQHRALHGPTMPAYDMPNPCTWNTAMCHGTVKKSWKQLP